MVEWKCEEKKEKVLVGICDKTQFCPGFGGRSVHLEKSAENCRIVKKIGGNERTPEGNAFSVGNVHAQFLHQSCREKLESRKKENFGKSKNGAAKNIQ